MIKALDLTDPLDDPAANGWAYARHAVYLAAPPEIKILADDLVTRFQTFAGLCAHAVHGFEENPPRGDDSSFVSFDCMAWPTHGDHWKAAVCVAATGAVRIEVGPHRPCDEEGGDFRFVAGLRSVGNFW